jgi:hypothetical protein
MSWTVAVVGGEWPMPDDPAYQMPALGTGAEVRERISAHLPGVDWSVPAWGQYAGDGNPPPPSPGQPFGEPNRVPVVKK